MQIVRHDCDVLLLQSPSVAKRKAPTVYAFVVLTLATAAGATWLAVASEWWTRLDLWCGLGVVLAMNIVIGLFGFLICDALLSECGLAFDRHSREILFVQKSWVHASREVFAFDQVRDVVLQRVSTKGGSYHIVRLMLTGGRKIQVANPAFECGGKGNGEKQIFEIAAALREVLGISAPAPINDGNLKGWPARLLNLTMSAAAIGGCVFSTSTAIELWQAPSWPQIEGVVQSVQVGKKMTSGKHAHLADAIEIVYHYRIGDIDYYGQRFNTRQNWLTLEEVLLVPQNYAVGARCRVSYKPDDPPRCYLRADLDLGRFIGLCIVTALLGLAGTGGLGYNLWRIMQPNPSLTTPA